MSRFFCDTNSELWFTKADELGIDVIGMPYLIEDDVRDYDLGRNTDFKDFYNKMRKGADPKTQALNMQNYIDYFEPVLAGGEDIIYVHFSREMSGTFNYMDQAISYLKEKYPERSIRTVDTKMVSIGTSVLVYEAAKLWKNGASDAEIVEFVETNKNNFALRFVVDNLIYLKRGGRLSAASMIFGTLLNIKPILGIKEEGVIVKCGVAKGLKKGLKTIVEEMKEIGSDVYKHPVIIAHADAEKNVEELKQELFAAFGDELEIWEQPVGPTVGTHCGPGTIGIVYHSSHR